MVVITHMSGRSHKKLPAALACLSCDADKPLPAREMRDITDYTISRKKQWC
jgi:hypothetical protein